MTGMRKSGFTLIELVIVIAIVSLLATAAAPLGKMATQRLKESELRSALRELRSGIDAYKRAVEEGRVLASADTSATTLPSGYPPTLDVLVNGVEDAADPNKRKIYFMRRLPRDPLYPDSAAPPAETWGLRSYRSPPEDPQPGDDVYDVYSLAKGVGLNGVPYREW
jgi:general secretion pathway protein G